VYAAVFPLLTARALTGPFDYLVPEELAARLQTGSLVAVALGRQTVLGVVVGRWLDAMLKTGIFFTAPLIMLGAAAGLWTAWRWMHRQ